MPQIEPDFRLDGYEAVNDRAEERFWLHFMGELHNLTALAEHHTDDDRHSYYVLHDASGICGVPGVPQIVALHIQRDPGDGTFRFQSIELPLPAMAQSWLIARGCPQEDIGLLSGTNPAPADEATKALATRLMSDGDHFAILASYTYDSPEAMVLLRALDERAPQPFRVLLEEVDTDAWTYTLREGGFASFEAATTWWEKRWAREDIPLPRVSPVTRDPLLPAAPARPAPAQPPRGRGR